MNTFTSVPVRGAESTWNRLSQVSPTTKTVSRIVLETGDQWFAIFPLPSTPVSKNTLP